MAFKFVLVLTFVAVASAGYVPSQQVYQAAPLAVAQPVLAKQVEEYDPHPQYKFAYDVQDAITGDSKNQVEVRDGDVVQGEYSLNDADGYRRIVRYTADDVHGFNAVVTRVPIGSPVKTIAAAPAVVNTVSPVVVAKAAVPVSFAAAPAPYAAPAYFKSAPAAYAAPTVVKSLAPVSYSAPGYYKAAPVAYSTPTYYKSAPVSYAAPAAVRTYSAPAQYSSSPLSYVSQAEVKTAVPISYSAPAYYKSAQVGYAAPSAYAAAPAVAYSH